MANQNKILSFRIKRQTPASSLPACSNILAQVSSPKSVVMKYCMLSSKRPYILPSLDNLLLHHAEHYNQNKTQSY